MFHDLDKTFMYCFIQHIKPKYFLEIGSGESTLVADTALKRNENMARHLAIEPYRKEYVPKNVNVIEKEMQNVSKEIFEGLQDGDMLFMDTSHVVKPYGDTLTQLVTLLPKLKKGVYVHIHDIFLPFDYKPNWMLKNSVYTEQWLVALMLY